MAGMEIASLFAKVGADVSDFSKGMDKVKTDLSFAEKGIGGLQNVAKAGFAAIGAAGVAAFTGIVAGMTHAVSAAADVEQAAANISAVFGNMAPPVAEVKDLINTLALDPSLVVGVEDAGAGIQMLAQNGLTWQQIADGAARSSILLANATGADLATSADIATNAMGIFGLQVTDLDSVVATFVNSANKSQFGVEDWGQALANAGPKAAAMGFKLEELFAAMTLTSSGFSSGMTMGTSWAWMINGLTPSTQKATDIMKELGLITADGANQFFNADGTGKGLTEVIKLLQGAFGNLTVEQQMTTSETLFGSEAFGALSGVLGLNNDQLNQLIPQMTDFSAVEAGAETRTNTFAAATAALTDTINSVFVMVGDKFLPVLTQMARQFADFVKENAPAVVEFFGGFATRLAEFIPLLGEMNLLYEDGSGLIMRFLQVFGMSSETAQAVGVSLRIFQENLIAVWEWVGNTIGKFVSWQDVLNAVGVVIASIVIPAIGGFLAAAAPVIAMFAAIVAASALLRNAWENDWLGIRSAITYAWDVIAGVFNSVMIKVAWIVDTFRAEWAVLTDTNATLGQKLSLIWNMIKDVAVTVWQGIVTTVQILWPKFRDAVMEWGTTAWQWLAEAIPLALDKIAEWGRRLWQWIFTNAPVWISALGQWAIAAWQWIVDATGPVLIKLGEWARGLWEWIVVNAPTWATKLALWAAAAWQWIVDAAKIAMTALGQWAGQIWQWATTNATEWGKNLAVWGDKAWSEFGERFPKTAKILETAWTTSQGVVTTAMDYFGAKFAPLGNDIKEFGVGALKEIGLWATGNKTDFENTQRIWETAKETFGAVFTDIGNKLTEWGELAWKWFKENFPQAADALTTAFDSISANFKELWDAVRPLIDTVVEAFNGLVEDWTTGSGDMSGALQTAKTIMDGIWTIMVSAVTLSINTMINTLTLVAQLLSGDWSGAWTTAQQIVSDVVGTLDTIVETALTTIGGLFGINKEDIKTWYDDTKTNITDWWTNFSTQIAERDWAGIGSDIMEAFDKTGIGEWYTETKQNILDWWETFKTYLIDKDWFKYGVDIVEGLWNGMKSIWGDFSTWATDSWTSIVTTFKSIFGIASPSKVFAALGENLMEGLSDGIAAAAIMPINAMDAMATTVQGKVTSMVDAVANSARTITNTINSMPALPAGYWSTPTLPTTPTPTPTPAPTTTPTTTPPNTVYTGGAGTGTAVTFGEKSLGLGLNMLATLVDTGDTIQDIIDFANQAKSFLTGNGNTPLQGSSAENLALRSLTSGGIDSLSVNNLIGQIQTLVSALTRKDGTRADQEFNISVLAPDASLTTQQQLEELVSYLNALYG